jgi:hypothetical protein
MKLHEIGLSCHSIHIDTVNQDVSSVAHLIINYFVVSIKHWQEGNVIIFDTMLDGGNT